MLSSLVPRQTHVGCDSVHAALVGLLQQTLLHGQPSVTLVAQMKGGHRHQLAHQSAHQNFVEVVAVLQEVGWLSSALDPQELSGHLDVLHPEQSQLGWRTRISLSQCNVTAAMLRVFLILRVRFLQVAGQYPTVRLVASAGSSEELDALYLLGDVFTERYPIRASWSRQESTVTLSLVGEPMPVEHGIAWERALFRRTRDLSVLFQPLRESLEMPDRPLVVPRVRSASDEVVRVRLPFLLQHGDHALSWLPYLQRIDDIPTFTSMDPTTTDEWGSHWHVELAHQTGRMGEQTELELHDTSYLVWRRPQEPDEFVSVSFRKEPTSAGTLQKPVRQDSVHNEIPISMEPLGGACEIGANGYYYRLGHRGLLIDAGLDANRNGWLGLPNLEQIEQLDAMILTHAHLDHMGALPVVLYAFPDLPIYCTRATRDILLPLLSDTAKIGQLRFRSTGEAPLISYDMVHAIDMERFCVVEPGETYDIPEIPGLSMKVHHAGHIMGAIAAELKMSDWHLLHTGDFSTFPQHSLDPLNIKGMKATHVVMEGTYSGRPSFSKAARQQNLDDFVEALYQAIDEHRCVLIPSFSVGRAQEMVSLIVEALAQTPTTAEVPIYTVGMINRINGLSCSVSEFFKEGYVERVQQAEPFKVDLNPRYTKEHQRAERYRDAYLSVAEKGPAVIVSSHGMMAENTGSYSIAIAILQQQPLLDRIFLCGYMDPRTPGSRLKRRFLYDETIPMGSSTFVSREAADEAVKEFSITSHASYEELEELALKVPQESVTLIHGDGFALHRFADHLRDSYKRQGRNLRVCVPDNGERISLGSAEAPEDWAESFGTDSFSFQELRGGGSLGHRGTRTRISPLVRSSGFAWLVIPVGESSTELRVEHDKHFDTIRYIEIYRNNVDTWDETWYLLDTYEDDDQVHDTLPSRIVDDRVEAYEWNTLDEVELYLEVSDAFGSVSDTRFDFSVVAEVQPTRFTFSANHPTLTFRVGGSEEPVLERMMVVDERYRNIRPLEVLSSSWNPLRRELTVQLRPQEVGLVERLQVWLRWPSGYLQRGPAVGPFSFVPLVRIVDSNPGEVSRLTIGEHAVLELSYDLHPGSLRWSGGDAWIEGTHELHLLPRRVGQHPLLSAFRDGYNDLVLFPVATLYVSPGLKMEGPSECLAGEPVSLRLEAAHPFSEDTEGHLLLNGELLKTFALDDLPLTISLGQLDPGQHVLEVMSQLDAMDCLLLSQSLEVLEHPQLLASGSHFVGCLDTKEPAVLRWRHLDEAHRRQLESWLESHGFAFEWLDDSLAVAGTSEQVGLHRLPHPFSTLEPDVPLLILDGISLRRDGMQLRWCHRGEPIPADWFSSDATQGTVAGGQPLLSSLVLREEPMVECRSSLIRGESMSVLAPGTFRVLLLSGSSMFREETIVLPWTPLPQLPTWKRKPKPRTISFSSLDTLLSSLERSLDTDKILPHAVVVQHNDKGEQSFQMQVAREDELSELVMSSVSEERERNVPVGLFYPGPRMTNVGHSLLSKLLQANCGSVTHLATPAPFAVLPSDRLKLAESYRLGERVGLPSHQTHNLGESYRCASCSKEAALTTGEKDVSLVCRACGWTARSPLFQSTLWDLYHNGTDILFSSVSTARRLFQGHEQRFLQKWADGSYQSFPFVSSREEIEFLSATLAPFAERWDDPPTERPSLDSLILSASMLLGWKHPRELFFLESLFHNAFGLSTVKPGSSMTATSWREFLTEILTKDLEKASKSPTLILLGVEALWSRDLQQVGHPCKPRTEGLRQWLSELNLSL
ncbi:MAG: MBL fold metallo-hydrolase [Deltaproteobacteria bacterium]|nr:MAG: MBL fold metallo-hydrolase [Deltaproteobacteria bacterium]